MTWSTAEWTVSFEQFGRGAVGDWLWALVILGTSRRILASSRAGRNPQRGQTCVERNSLVCLKKTRKPNKLRSTKRTCQFPSKTLSAPCQLLSVRLSCVLRRLLNTGAVSLRGKFTDDRDRGIARQHDHGFFQHRNRTVQPSRRKHHAHGRDDRHGGKLARTRRAARDCQRGWPLDIRRRNSTGPISPHPLPLSRVRGQKGVRESAGQNRHGVADERAAWKRISEPFQP